MEKKFKFSTEDLMLAWKYMVNKWVFLMLALLIGAGIGYYRASKVQPKYTATINFVLSSEQKPTSISGLAVQMGFDMGAGTDNIFSGDNILDFFKSRSLIGKALLTTTDSQKQELLLNLIARKHYAPDFKKLGPFGALPVKYSVAQTVLYREIITYVSKGFVVLKKDKKLIFYLINATDTDPDVAYYIAKNMLAQTSTYFIETKTKVSRESVRLMEHVADSVSRELSALYSSTASLNDRTYNINPSVSVQRSGMLFLQSKAIGLSQGYQQLLHNLENAKMSLQRETPLYQIIDMPELPLAGIGPNYATFIAIGAFTGLFLISIILLLNYFRINRAIIIYQKNDVRSI